MGLTIYLKIFSPQWKRSYPSYTDTPFFPEGLTSKQCLSHCTLHAAWSHALKLGSLQLFPMKLDILFTGQCEHVL